MSRKTVGVLIGAVILIGALGGTGYYFRNEIKEMVPFLQEGSTEDKVYVEKISRVMNQNTGISNRYNGTVESQDTYEVNVDTSRKVDKIHVEEGDVIEEGQTLVSYDTSDLKLQIQQADLEVESIHNDIDNYNKQIETLAAEREKAADSEKFSYTTQIQTLENSIAQKNFDLESKKLEISKYQTQVGNSTVTSKVGGIVKDINEKGVDATGNSAPFMTILQTGEYRIKGSIDEQNIWMLAEGQDVLIRSRVDETKTWKGVIAAIDTENPQSGNNSSGYVTPASDGMQTASKYPFYIELDSADGLILGQHVYIEMDEGQEEKKEGLWLYGSYIVQNEESPYVWAANEKERLEKCYIELGEYDDALDEYEIISGVKANDYITWPMPGLYEGITTVTNADEVDYSSPLYNQGTENGMGEGIYGTESVEGFGGMDLYSTEGMESLNPNDLSDSTESSEGSAEIEQGGSIGVSGGSTRDADASKGTEVAK